MLGFDPAACGTNLRCEAIAGATTFLAAACIIFVYPAILTGTGMDAAAVAGVTCLIAAAGTLFAVYRQASYVHAEGDIPGIGRMLTADTVRSAINLAT